MDLTQRISNLSPQQRKMLALKLEQRNINIDILKLPITRENRTYYRQRFPLSFQQEGLWLIHQLNPNNSAYNIIRAATLEGTLNIHALEQSINEIIQRHDILRTIFISDKQAPVQVILNELSLPLQINDLKDVSNEKQEQEIKRIIRDESQYVFDLTTGPLLRTKLFILSENKYMFLLVIHHIISDGTSIQIFIRELVQLYEAFSQGKPTHLPEQTIHYVDYACWQRQWYILIKKQEEFWLEQFKGEIPILNLPLDYPRPTIQNFEGSTLVFHLSSQETNLVKKIALKKKTTLYVVLLTIYNILLSKLSSSEDIIVGTPVAGRQHPGVQKLMGMFVNTLALRNYPHQNKTGKDFLEQVRDRTLKAFENQEYQYENLLARVKVTRDNSRNPLFDVMFLLGNVDLAKINTRGLVFKIYNDENNTAKFDLTLRAWEQGDRLHFRFEYCTKLFKPATIRRMSNYFKRIVESVIENLSCKIKDIEIISPQKKRETLAQFNRDLKDTFDWDTLQHKLFQAPRKHPDQVAIEYGTVHVSYSQLDKHSTQISCWILHHGIEKGSFIGIYQDDPIHIISFILGILKAACVFVPLDTVIPVKRIRQMTRLTHLTLIFTTAFHKEQLTSHWKDMPQNIELIEIGSTFYKQYQLLPAAHEVDYKGDDPIYVYFTSGTTGAPRAILGKNISLLQFINWEMETFGITTGFRVSQLTSIGFDAFLRNVFIPLCAGGVVCIPTSQELVMDSEALIDWIDRSRIHLIHCVPAVFRLFNPETLTPHHFKNLKYVFTAGDIIYPHELKRWYRRFEHRVQLVNGYGTTETTMFKTYHLIQKSDTRRDRIPVGQPIRGTSVIILDENLQVCDQGIVGEIYIRTPYSTWGYCNDPQLNKEKLIPNPFNHDPSDLVFRTGDLARLLEDGSIEFLARKDAQVKIRGIRVELGEIESQLLKHTQIKECVIVARSDEKKENYLCTYIVTARGQSVPGLREYLKSYLPGYMIPAYFVFINRIPLTPNLKVDLTALPVPELKTADNDTLPETHMEKKLASIWSEVLKTRKEVIAVDSNFFEMGGHSLLAANMAARVHKEFQVRLPLAEIFKTPTIRGISQYIQEAGQDKYTSIKPVEKKEYYQLSSAQKRLYILQQMDDQHTAYNMPQLIPLDESPGFERLENAFMKLIRRHESLRTSFEIVNDQPIQKTHQPNEIKFAIQYYDMRKVDVEEEDQTTDDRGQTTDGKSATHMSSVVRYMSSEFIRPFDLSRTPLIRVGIIKIEPLKHIVLIDMHHIISDAISMKLMRKDFIALYENRELHELRIHYKDYAEWQNSGQQKKVIKKQEEYWLKEINDGAAMLNLPFDYPRPPAQSFAGDRINFEIGKERQEALKKIAKARDATLFMVLLAAYNVLLAKLTGQEDIIIGTPTAGRQHADLEHIIGMFVNTLALRNYPSPYQSFERFLEEMKQRTLEAFDHQDYPFEDLVEKISLQRDTSRNPVFDVMFSLHNTDDRPGNTAGSEESARYEVYGIRKGISKFDLTFIGIESNDQLTFIVEYCTKLFKKETMERFVNYFNRILNFVVKNSKTKIYEIDLLPGEEKKKILYHLNETTTPYPKNKTIHELFAQQVEQTPDHIALVGKDEERNGIRVEGEKESNQRAKSQELRAITYKELNHNSNQLSHLLKEKGIQTDTMAGIMVERSPKMIIGILGILKTGGAYLPIEPDYPEERINYMLADSNVNVLITTSNLFEDKKIGSWEDRKNLEIVLFDFSFLPPFHPSVLPSSHLRLSPAPDTSLAYIIYTSGSTGKPKGVMINHQNVVPLVKNPNFIDFTPGDRLLLTGNFLFDITTFETWWPLLNGLTLFPADQQVILDPEKLENFINQHEISILHLIPQLFNQLAGQRLEIFERLKYFLVGGDLVRPHYVNLLRNTYKDIKILHMYGPTENTTFSTFHPVNQYYDTTIPIGKPISNSSVYIVDKYNKPVPIGIPGELLVGGDGVARGYLNNPELTEDKFNRAVISHSSVVNKNFLRAVNSHSSLVISSLKTNNKFSKSTNDQCSMTNDRSHWSHPITPIPQYPITPLPHSSIYRTGDLARWQSDWNIEFLGRVDFQVKIRGIRIELGEIENRLLEHEKIREAVVIDRESSHKEKYICAYIVPGHEQTLDSTLVNQLREYLSKTLSHYMIPSFFVPIEKIPLTPNGKIDRKALPEPKLEIGEAYVAPMNDTENKLVDIWSDVLGIERDKIGTNSNFFELGGHSLKATLIAAKIHKELNVKIPLSEVFKLPTLKDLFAYIRGTAKDKFIAVKVTEKKEYYDLSSAQKRLYVLQQMELKAINYNIPLVAVLKGDLTGKKFEETFGKLIKRHESLRTSFAMINENPVQRIHKEVEFEIEYYDLTRTQVEVKVKVEEKDGTGGLAPLPIEPAAPLRHPQPATALISSFIRSFDLSQALLMRVGLVKEQDKTHILMIDIHHIITDGTSMGIFIREFMKLYAGEELPATRIQYKDFSEWENKRDKSEEKNKQEEYWKKQFAGDIPVMDLPTDYPRPSIKTYAGNSLSFEINTEETRAVKSLVSEQGITLFIALAALFDIFLSKISSQEEVIIGIPTAGRQHADLTQIIGMFVNTLVLRNHPAGNKTIKEFLNEVKENTLAAYANQEYQFEELVEKLALNRDISRNPLFEVMFSLQNAIDPEQIREIKVPDLNLIPYPYEERTAKFDLELVVVESNNRLSFTFVYSSKLFKKETLERFINYFKRILNFVVENSKTKIYEIDLLPGEEKKKILYQINETTTPYPKNKTIHELFAQQVEQTPDHIALVGKDEASKGIRVEEEKRAIQRAKSQELCAVTYKELNNNSNQLSHLLREKGIQADTMAGIMVERSSDMIIGILGILKTGGAYLPIEPDYPEERINYMLADSGAKVLISTSILLKEVKKFRSLEVKKNFEIIFIDSIEFSRFSSSHLLNFSTSHSLNLAYIIYTSGSTGKPKGVLIQHQNVVRLVKNSNFIDFIPGDRLLLTGAFVFDLTTFEIWWPLLNGLSLFLANQEVVLDAEKLKDFITKNKISILHLIPQLFNQLAAQQPDLFSSLRCFLVGGDLVRPQYVNRLRNTYKDMKILHMYGPTENTTFSTFHPVNRDYEGTIPIGKPISNTLVYILDAWHHLVPMGITGELCLGGDGIARGYLNQPELTNSKFLTRNKDWPGNIIYMSPRSHRSYIYKTGDLARWLVEGSIQFQGRQDHQVKIRGVRIELGEIERQLLTHHEIKETAVLFKTDKSGDKYLCAYIVTSKPESELELKNYLSQFMPDYMIPSYFVQIEEMPLKPNGKINRKALPEPKLEIGEAYVAPINDTEHKLVHIWSDVLGIESDKIGTNSNFFELGGHSLKAILVTAKIHKELNVKIPLSEFFKLPTLKDLFAYIRGTAKDKFIAVKVTEKKEYYDLSSAQKRLYVLQQMELKAVNYNIPLVTVLKGDLTGKKFEETFRKLIKRHESLRTSFHMIADQPYQRVQDQVEFKIEYNEPGKEGTIKNFVRPFDLSQAPLMRVELIELPHTPAALRVHPSKEGKVRQYILMIDIHHIITDGTSMGILIKEFMKLYAGEELPGTRIQYKDFSKWENKRFKSGEKKKQEEYWKKQFAGDIPVMDLPTDYPRPGIKTFTGNSLSVEINTEETRAIKSLVSEQGITLFIALAALFDIFLSKISSQEEVIIGIPTAGRRHADLAQIIGMFVNTLVLRNHPAGHKTIKEFLNEVKENALAAFENQEYQFEELVEKLALNRDISRNPLFEVMFSLQNQTDPEQIGEIEVSGLKLEPYQYEERTAKFDLELIVVESNQLLSFTFIYGSKLFKKETMERFVNYFKRIVNFVVENSETKIYEIDLLPGEEKKKILYHLNETTASYPKNKTIHELFAQQVEQTPDHIALVGKDEGKKGIRVEGEKEDSQRAKSQELRAISYKELNHNSNQLSHLLKEKGIQTDTMAGIMVERSPGMIIGILGILKAGGAYLPIEPDYPEERINYMLADSGAKVLVTTSTLAKEGEKLRSLEVKRCHETIFIDTLDFSNLSSSQLLNFSTSPSSLAYIIYTSGTTGKPKAVMVQHFNVVRLGKNTNYIQFKEGDRILQTGALEFDASTFEIWGSLLNGLQLSLVKNEIILSPGKLKDTIEKNRITTIWLTAPLFNHLLDQEIEIFRGLKNLLVGGDVLSPSHINRLRNQFPRLNIINGYGPTENTTFSTTYLIDREYHDPIPIGKPIANSTAYIVDKYGNLQPVGIVGELWVGGDGVARGYLNNPELTADKFPTVSSKNYRSYMSHMSYIYQTGDLARWQPDGNIQFLGRQDHQVKIRGFRIELGEIESQLLKHTEIKEAVVLYKTDKNGDKYLCAYIVTIRQGLKLELKNYLSQFMPDYMIPSYFVQIEKIPLTPNGKIDRKALPAPELKPGEEYEAPGSEIEKKLAVIWSELLGIEIDLISINANFFELGGHSLSAATLVSKIRKEFNVNLPLVELFKNPFIKSLAESIRVGVPEAALFSPKDDNLILLKPGTDRTDSANHIFLIHDGTGEVEGYMEFCKHLTNDMNYWGIRADRLENLAPRNQTIQEMSRNYIEKMKRVQAEGPYYIVGWSFGGIIAFEMVNQLEQGKENIGFLGLIDSPPPYSHKHLLKKAGEFNLESELNFVKDYSDGSEITEKLKNVNKLSELWLLVKDYLETTNYHIENIKKAIVEYGMQALPNFHQLNLRESVYYLNVGRTFRHALLNYTPEAKVHALIYYFAAAETKMIIKERWNDYCCKPISFYEVSGDHFSIFKMPEVKAFAKLFEKALQKK